MKSPSNIFIYKPTYIMTIKKFRPGSIQTLELESKDDSDSDTSESWNLSQNHLELNWNCDEWNSES